MSKINIFALGGLNEVGKNMYVVKVDEEIYIFDAGMKFNVENAYGVDYILPDYNYLKENINKIKLYFEDVNNKLVIENSILNTEDFFQLNEIKMQIYCRRSV